VPYRLSVEQYEAMVASGEFKLSRPAILPFD
jgi:hypothetical protein